MVPKVYTRRASDVCAVQHDGTRERFNSIYEWMEGVRPEANRGYWIPGEGADVLFTVASGPRDKPATVRRGDWVLHRFIGGHPMFWVLTAEEFAELYDPAGS